MTKRFLLMLGLALSQVTVATAQAHLLIVSGLGGEPRYSKDFVTWGTEMADAATKRYGVAAEDVVYLAEDPTADPRIDGEARVSEIERVLGRMAETMGPDDRLMVLLIGHGSADSRGSRMNLPGPDLTATELDSLLDAFPTQPIAVVNTTSASGDFQEALAAENRAVVTATRSGMERNETMFGGFFVEAFVGDGADADLDGRITVAEAYDFATTETTRAYENDNRLQLEHARMEGNLELARAFHLGAPAEAIPADASPAVRALYEERQRLEASIESLRVRAAQMDEDEYQRQLEELLLDLARTNQEIQRNGGEN